MYRTCDLNPTVGSTYDEGLLYNCVVDILPFLEQEDTFNAWNPNRVYFDPGNRTVNRRRDQCGAV